MIILYTSLVKKESDMEMDRSNHPCYPTGRLTYRCSTSRWIVGYYRLKGRDGVIVLYTSHVKKESDMEMDRITPATQLEDSHIGAAPVGG